MRIGSHSSKGGDGAAKRGSQKWLQVLVNECPNLINKQLCSTIGLPPDSIIEWLSPRRDSRFIEYSDQEFLERTGIQLSTQALREFWPRGGPVWDALGRTERGDVLLVEAKSHISEIVSSKCGARGKSRKLIRASLGETKRFLAAKAEVDWCAHFYQYANRLAHLYLLRQLNGVRAYLVFLYLVNDHEMHGPTTEDEWKGAIALLRSFLGVSHTKLGTYIIDVFVDVDDLAKVEKFA